MDDRMTPELLRREYTLLWEAQSAVAQCTLALGEERTNRIIAEIGGVIAEIRDRMDSALNAGHA